MNEHRPGAPDPRRPARDVRGRQAQAHAAIPDGERAAIRERLQMRNGLNEWERQAEQLALLPDIWSTVYGAGPGFLCLFAATRPSPAARLTDTAQAFFAWPGEVAAALRWVQRNLDRELYQAAHLTTRWRRRKEDAAPFASLWVDLDHDELRPDQLPPPSVTIESSPGRLQGYWRLTEPVPPAVGERLNRWLARALGADVSGWDATQLLRVAGGRNGKYPSKPLVRVVGLTGRQYGLDDLARPLADVPRAAADLALSARPTSEPAAPVSPDWLPERLSRAGRKVWEGRRPVLKADGSIDRSASLVRIARVLFDAGLRRTDIVAALVERDLTLGWEKYSGRRDAQQQYHAIVALVERNTQ